MMTEKASCKVSTSNISEAIHEVPSTAKPSQHVAKVDEDDDLIFGALDDENEPKNHSAKVEHTKSCMSTGDDEWENIQPITESDRPTHHLQPSSEKNSSEQIIGMSNFRAKHRLRHHAKANTLVRWKAMMKKAVHLKDPWLDFQIDQYPEETVTRHEFDPVKRTWHTSEIIIKIESQPFARGSMRECYRLKKLSIFSTHQDWNHSSNYIAKRYIEDVPMARYFDDVMMQMTTKLWAAHYNHHNPPKKVDIVQMSVLEFKNRAGRPYYHLERFIDGNYIKYNSNSGFVCDETLRHTPQAFSHFTFEASGHEQIVVDIQGVGDLYTDPQIHTSLGYEYGEGNLGTRGMALFFSTHECNPICAHLSLSPFDLTLSERERQLQQHALSPSFASNLSSQTACRGSEEPLNNLSKLSSVFRQLRSQSSISEDESDGYVSETSSLTAATGHTLEHSLSIPEHRQFMTTFSEENLPLSPSMNAFHIPPLATSISMSASSLSHIPLRVPSETTWNMEELYNTQLSNNPRNNHRPSSVILEKEQLERLHQISAYYQKYESILGQIHLELCKYYQIGRFSELGSEEFDEVSAFYHLEQAAELSVRDAIFSLAKVDLDLPRDLLPNYHPTNLADQLAKGVHLLTRASKLGETEANLHLAQIYDRGMDESIKQDWNQAAKYYDKYLHLRENESNNIDEDSGMSEPNSTQQAVPFHDQHDIVARLASLYKTGGYHLVPNYQKSGDLFNKAAEMATAAMKGRLATKYYQSAEEAYALEENEDN